MNSEPICFVAPSAQEVVAQIRSKLGPEAVVLNVRPVRPPGLARYWRKPMIEVLACRPQSPALEPPPAQGELAELRSRMSRLEQHFHGCPSSLDKTPIAVPAAVKLPVGSEPPDAEALDSDVLDGGVLASGESTEWRVGPLLQRAGLLPIHASYLVDQLRARHGERPPALLSEEMGLSRSLLSQMWTPSKACGDHLLHVLIGAPGCGKTTCLCKWLTQAALVEGRLARVWRLDGATANLAQNLSVYCEVLGVAVDRFWHGPPRHEESLGAGIAEDIGFIDLPGVDWRDTGALEHLAKQLEAYGPCHVHLVLNAAYGTSVLLAQLRAFASVPVSDLIVTHLDEEPRWGKLWNLVLGTNYTIGYLSTGQNIPGEFRMANAEIILADQFPCK